VVAKVAKKSGTLFYVLKKKEKKEKVVISFPFFPFSFFLFKRCNGGLEFWQLWQLTLKIRFQVPGSHF